MCSPAHPAAVGSRLWCVLTPAESLEALLYRRPVRRVQRVQRSRGIFFRNLGQARGIPQEAVPKKGASPEGARSLRQTRAQSMEEQTDPSTLPRAAQVHRSLQLEAKAAANAGSAPEWLVEFEQRSEAAAVDRLAADSDLLYRLQVVAFTGPDWDYFVHIIAKYGLQVLYAWIRMGVIVQKCRQRGIVRGLPPGEFAGPLQHVDAEDLASDTTSVAINTFRDEVLMKNRWQPDGGASLKTFFIGQALWRYPDVNASWRRQLGRSPWLVTDPIVLPDSRPADDPENVVVERMMLPVAAEGLDPNTLKVITMNVAGFSHAEIASELGDGANAKTVENLLYRHKVRQGNLRQQKGA